jgi:hypothetical protein
VTIEILSFILGALLLLTGILGGGFEAKEVKIPKISGSARIIAAVAGVVFIGVAFINPEPPDRKDGNEPLATMSPKEWDINRPALDLQQGFDLPHDDPELCQNECRDNPQCEAWTYVKPDHTQGLKPRCWLKHAIPQPQHDPCCVSGTKIR